MPPMRGLTPLAAPPPYFPLSQSELFEYVQSLAAALPLPLLLYNMPAMTKVCFAIETVRRLPDNPRIIGIKDSSGDKDYFAQLIPLARVRADCCVLIGQEQRMSDAVISGAQGGVNGGANVFPSLFSALYNATVRRDSATISRLQKQVVALGQVYHVVDGAAPGMRGIKCALNLLGICSDYATMPFARLQGADREVVRNLIEQIGKQVAADAGQENVCRPR